MKKVRWAVIGATGFAQSRTIPEGILAAENAELSGIMARDEDRLRLASQKFDDVFYTTDVDILVARDDVDAVYIATPTVDHLLQALAALRAGKHVLVEKPAAMNPDEALQMQAGARAGRLCLGTAFMMPYHGAHQEIARLIQVGEVGQLVYGRAQIGFWYPPIAGSWRQAPEQGGGGSFADVGVHAVSLLEMFFGKTRAVQAQTRNAVQDYRSEDSAIALLEFEKGALGIVEAFFNLANGSTPNALEIYGSQGSVRATGTIGQGAEGTAVLRRAEQDHGDCRETEIAYQPVNPYRAEIEAFSQAVITGDRSTFDFTDGLHSVNVMHAVYLSAQSGRRIEVGV